MFPPGKCFAPKGAFGCFFGGSFYKHLAPNGAKHETDPVIEINFSKRADGNKDFHQTAHE
jgi:hypothetical protein